MKTKFWIRITCWWRLLPLIFLGILALFLWRGLSLQPNLLPSVLLNKPLPAFQLPNLLKPETQLTERTFMGEVALVNVWASWCNSCHQEHHFLMTLAAKNMIAIYGLNYRDEAAAALKWLDTLGNPYRQVAFDQKGTVAIDWGVYGAPETFLLDKQGIVRYRHVGVLTEQVWQERLLPIIKQLSTGEK